MNFVKYVRGTLFTAIMEIDSEITGDIDSLRAGADELIDDIADAAKSVVQSVVGLAYRAVNVVVNLAITTARVAITLVFGPETED